LIPGVRVYVQKCEYVLGATGNNLIVCFKHFRK
jgi:hypothetical protein